VSSFEVIAALVGLLGVGVGSAKTYLQQRADRAENWRHDRETRWDQDRRAVYVRFLTDTDELYRAVDFQDEHDVQMALVGVQRSVALSASDAVYRTHAEVLLMCQTEGVEQAADKLKDAAVGLYGIAKSVTADDITQRQRLTDEFRDTDKLRRKAMKVFLAAAAKELKIRSGDDQRDLGSALNLD
jgi:hypothetical protein